MLAGMERQRDARVALDPLKLLAEPEGGREPDPAALAVPQPDGATAVATAPPAGVR